MSRFVLRPTPIDGLQVIKRQPIGDTRGYLERMFCNQDLKILTDNRSIKQINHTLTQKRGTVRGMHFQYQPNAEMKLVSCVRGEVFDVAVDIRRNSPTFLQWYAEILSEKNYLSLCIPEGFAHGFQTLTSDCELLYFHTANYNAEDEGALNVLDPRLAISWPEPITECSERDTRHPILMHDFKGIDL